MKLAQSGQEVLAQVDKIARDVVGPAAASVDAEARYPAEAFQALKEAGLLGLVIAPEAGGLGQDLRTAAAAAERLARECPSTAMLFIMHVCASAVIDKHGDDQLKQAIARDRKTATLAFSEYGSRSHFWAPVSTAEFVGDSVRLNAKKQLITGAGRADVYVWSSRPAAAEGLSSIWAVPSSTSGLSSPDPYEGLGLRGNSSAPLTADAVEVPRSSALGADGQGFDIMMGVVMPFFSILSCAVSVGLMEGALERTIGHVSGSTYAYDNSRLCDLPQVRGHVARARLKLDLVRGLLLDTLNALEEGRADATLRVLEAKLAGGETSLEVLDLCMRVCGGAAFRKDLALERYFRDSRASSVMAPVSDALYDFIGKAVCGMPVFG